MDHQGLGYREIISLETLVYAVCGLLDCMYGLKENVGLLCGTQVPIPQVPPKHIAVETPQPLADHPYL